MVWESSNGGNFWTEEEKTIRLYARQRVVVAHRRRQRQLLRRLLWVGLTVVGVGLAATVARSAGPKQPSASLVAPVATQSAQTAIVTVSAGDSLWSIAESYGSPQRSTRDNMAVIASLNGNISGKLEPGQRLVIPTATP